MFFCLKLVIFQNSQKWKFNLPKSLYEAFSSNIQPFGTGPMLWKVLSLENINDACSIPQQMTYAAGLRCMNQTMPYMADAIGIYCPVPAKPSPKPSKPVAKRLDECRKKIQGKDFCVELVVHSWSHCVFFLNIYVYCICTLGQMYLFWSGFSGSYVLTIIVRKWWASKMVTFLWLPVHDF